MQATFISALKNQRIFCLILVALFLPVPLIAQAQDGEESADQQFVDPFEAEDDRPTPAPRDEEDRPRLGDEEFPYEEFPERQVVEEQPAPDPSERPDGPVELRFKFDAPHRYDVNNQSRIGYENRPEFRKFYQSGMAVEYRPITELQRAQLPTWQMRVGAAEDEEIREQDQILLASVYSFSGSFQSPHELSDTARTHQILKDAHFSFRLSERGKVSDIKIHPPTNPLARSSLEEIVRLITESHPLFPEDAIEPGDSWTQTIELRTDEDTTVLTQDAELTYTFNGWTRCGQSFCARIDVEQSLNAAGRYVVRHIETRSSADGSGEGWFLFDPDRGRIVRSHWNIDSQGHTNTRRRTNEGTMQEVVDIRFNLSVESTTRLIERSPATYQLVPVDDQD